MEIQKINLAKSRPYKDFGKGFYTTTIEDQAWSMAKRTVRTYGGICLITVFSFDDKLLAGSSLRVRMFDNPDNEWAAFVMNNRNRLFQDITNSECNLDNKYDIVSGPVADDDLVALFNLRNSGILSAEALAVEMTYRKLTHQLSFHTEKAVSCLTKKEVRRG
jgi:hypothetical protein